MPKVRELSSEKLTLREKKKFSKILPCQLELNSAYVTEENINLFM